MIVDKSKQDTPLVMEVETDPAELVAAWALRKRADRNWDWFNAHATEIYRAHRGKVVCVAGEELFVATTTAEVLAVARAAHPEDDGRLTWIIPAERGVRIYAH